MSEVDAMLANEIYPAARNSVDVESFAQYKPIALTPEINKPKTDED